MLLLDITLISIIHNVVSFLWNAHLSINLTALQREDQASRHNYNRFRRKALLSVNHLIKTVLRVVWKLFWLVTFVCLETSKRIKIAQVPLYPIIVGSFQFFFQRVSTCRKCTKKVYETLLWSKFNWFELFLWTNDSWFLASFMTA